MIDIDRLEKNKERIIDAIVQTLEHLNMQVERFRFLVYPILSKEKL